MSSSMACKRAKIVNCPKCNVVHSVPLVRNHEKEELVKAAVRAGYKYTCRNKVRGCVFDLQPRIAR
jgi:hypothetical protein